MTMRRKAQFIWLKNAEVSSAFFRTENVDYDGRFISVLRINYNKCLNRDKKKSARTTQNVYGESHLQPNVNVCQYYKMCTVNKAEYMHKNLPTKSVITFT